MAKPEIPLTRPIRRDRPDVPNPLIIPITVPVPAEPVKVPEPAVPITR